MPDVFEKLERWIDAKIAFQPMNVHRINDETTLAFIRRVKVVNVDNLCARFGWDTRTARAHIDTLERGGFIEKVGRRGYELGARLEWRAK